MAIEKITIRIETGNAAFEETPATEIARILRKLAADFENHGLPSPVLRDLNGNACGSLEIAEDDSNDESEG